MRAIGAWCPLLIAFGCTPRSTVVPESSDRSAAVVAETSSLEGGNAAAPRLASGVSADASSESSLSGTSAANEPSRDGASPSPREYTVDRWTFRLIEQGGRCALEYGSRAGERRTLALDLAPPCHVLRWHSSLPRVTHPTKAPIGGDGDPMAWRYREKDGDIVAVALIGDSVPERLHSSDRFREAQTQGYHCGGSAQGVIFRASSDAKTITKRNQVDIFCVEIPIEEPSFWLTTHEPPNR